MPEHTQVLASPGLAGARTARRLPRWDLLAAVVIGAVTGPVSLFGVAQLAQTVHSQLAGPAEVTDFLHIYTAARLLLSDPSHVYATGVVDAAEKALSAGRSDNLPFLYLPSAVPFLAPLGLLDYGVAYAVWLAFNVGCLVAATLILAPGRPLAWLLLLVVFLPAQFGLIMGQTSALALLSFALFIRLVGKQCWAGLQLGALPFGWKPHLLPSFVVALAASRRWWSVAGLLAVPAALSGAVVLAAGPSLLADYRAASTENSDLVFQRVPYQQAGQTLLGVFQGLVQPGLLSVVLYGAIAVLVEVGVALLWWRGLRADARASLQLAALPIAAVLVAPHALVYELTTWLASAWLLVRYTEARPDVRTPIVAVCLVGWVAANIDTLTERDLGFPLAALVGLVALGLIAWLYRGHPVASSHA